MRVMAETTFSVKYEGPALDEGRMPVRDLAPALLALGELFREASKDLYPDLPVPSLDVKANEKGSFDVQMVLAADGMWEQVVNLLSAKGPTALNNLLGLVIDGGVVGTGVFKLIQIIGKRKVKREEATDDPDQMRIILDDETIIEAPAGTVRIYRNPKIRRAARDAVAPLKRPKMKQVKFETPETPAEPLTVKAADIPAFDLAAETQDEEVVSEVEIDVTLDVFSPELEPGSERKWRFGGLGDSFMAKIEDPEFAEKVANHEEVFGVGDQLEATVEIVQKRDPESGRIRDTRRVVKVKRVIKGPQQLPLGPDPESDD
jgi:hypothetical protein